MRTSSTPRSSGLTTSARLRWSNNKLRAAFLRALSLLSGRVAFFPCPSETSRVSQLHHSQDPASPTGERGLCISSPRRRGRRINMITSGSIEEVSLKGRRFAVAADADVNVGLGGFNLEKQDNGDGSVRYIKTRVGWKLDGVQLAM